MIVHILITIDYAPAGRLYLPSLYAVIVVGPVLGYIEQYRMVQKTGSVGSFSTDICAILLISNIVRVYFWFAAGFGTPLLLQAFLMITAQVGCIGNNVVAATQGLRVSQPEKFEAEGKHPRQYILA